MKLYRNYLMDMDGVLVRGRTVVDGTQRFIDALNARGWRSRADRSIRFIPPATWRTVCKRWAWKCRKTDTLTSAIATARFIKSQQPGGKAFVIGESGLDGGRPRCRLHYYRHPARLRRAGRDAWLQPPPDHARSA